MKHPMKLTLTFLIAAALPLLAQTPAPQGPARQGTESGFATFQAKCLVCHGNPNVEGAPSPSTLRQFTPEKIYEALTTGQMKVQGQDLSDEQRKRVAESIAGRLLGTADQGDAAQMPNRCASNPAMTDPSASPEWNGWGVDATNTRFQPAKSAQITPAQIPNLKLRWAFGFPGAISSYSEPTVASGRVFVSSDAGYVYSIDAKSGCVYWSYQTKAGVRNAPTFGPVKGAGEARYAVFFGDVKANVYGLDAHTGKELWTAHVEDHFTGRVTAAPKFYDGKLFVPVSSWEEFSARALDYGCCTFRGSVVALDANTGKQIWKTYSIAEAPRPTRKNSMGTQLYAPAGASVWNTPTIDAKNHAVYFGTGDAETEPAALTSDAIMAVDINTGKVLWSYQADANDSYLSGCTNPGAKTENCPNNVGPDYDIGNSPILKTMASGKRVLIAGTKIGQVFALDPDKKGALLWRINALPKGDSGRMPGIVWGGASDDQNAYYGMTAGGVVAVQLATGEVVWTAPLTPGVGNGAVITAIPGAVFTPDSKGRLIALSARDGSVLWTYESAKDYDTVNKVPAKGGSIRAPGITVVGGMVFVSSGYGMGGTDTPGNVMLAFSPE